MSVYISGSAWFLAMVPMRKMVLLALADNATDEGVCWPSQATLAQKVSISERSLRDHLHALVSDGWVAITSLGNGRGKSTEYLLNVARIKAEGDAAFAIRKAEAGAQKAEPDAEKAETSFRPTVIQPSEEPSGSPPARTRKKQTEVVPLNAHERLLLLTDYTDIPSLDDEIELALAHESARKYPTGQYRHVRGWLNRKRRWITEDANKPIEFRERRPGSGRVQRHADGLSDAEIEAIHARSR